jgi:outer membrane PBP1 activator LpoA protein
MQRFSFGFLFLAALYVSASANATPDLPTAAVPVAASSVLAASGVAAPTVPQVFVPDNPAPHIALLLPLKSKSAALVHAAEIVQQGFTAAASVQQGLPVRVYASTDEAKEAVTFYRQALANGAVTVVGPLTRDGVAALAGYPGITVPTLALNTSPLPQTAPKLYFFGLPTENEARQVAQMASYKLHDATIISNGSAISVRLAAAFAEEWKRQGGNITDEVVFNGDFSDLTDLPVAPWPEGTAPKPVLPVSANGELIPNSRPLPPPIAPGNMAFLAMDQEKARLIRPYLNPTLPIYGTSLLFKGNDNKLANYDLNEVHFVDMPWLLQPDHPAVMIYPRSATPLDAELERLYALGIDAYRLGFILLGNQMNTLPLDGVTGKLSLAGQQFLREPSPAFFRQGLGLTTETLAELNAAKAAAKAAEKAAKALENGSFPPSSAPAK